MRTTIHFDTSIITAQCRMEDRLRAAAQEQTIAAAWRPKQRRYDAVIRLGRTLIQIGERLQAMARQPA